MRVYIVYTEYQNGEPAIIGAYASRKSAELAVARETEAQTDKLGNVIFGEDNEDDWDVDIHCEEFEVEP